MVLSPLFVPEFVRAPFLLSVAFLAATQVAVGQVNPNRASMLVKVLTENHYSPRTLNNEFSGQVFDKFLQTLDPNGLYFTQAEVNALKNYRLKLDDELKGTPAAFLKFVTPFYKDKLVRARALSQKILQAPLNFSEPGSFTFESDSVTFAADEKAFQKRWQNRLKYQSLNLLIRTTNAAANTIKPEAEAEARRKTRLATERNFKRLLESPEGFEEMVQNLYLNAIAFAYDPHTLYLSKNEYEDYKGGTSTSVFSFGLTVDENELGEIEVSQVIPGSPAWKCNQINKGDVLEALKPPGKSRLDLTGSDADEAQALLDATQTGKFDFIFRKKNGLEKTVSLAQEKVESENIVRSFLLNGDKKIGYISLPGFYTEWENMEGLGCANDVAREILQLQREGIEGLILDIRYNGGGSMMEASNLAGLFVDEGPLFMRKGKDGKPIIMKDTNRGTVYNGPLTVLVNGQSASASEILAATLQDYNRALVVGMPTYGKATAQVVLPVGLKPNASLREQENSKSANGYAVVTVEKLFRVSGKTAQLHGIKPDILLPDPFSSFYETEADYKTALAADSLTKKAYYYPLAPLPLAELRKKSENRQGLNTSFQQIKTFAATMEQKQAPAFPLNLAGFRKAMAETDGEMDAAEKFLKATSVSYKALEPKHEQQLLKVSAYSKEMNTHLIKQLEADIYLEEAYQITKDLINQTKTP